MKRITITLPDPIANKFFDWADQQDRPAANLLAYIAESAIKEAEKAGEFQPRPNYDPEEKGFKFRSKAEQRLLKQVGQTLKALANDEPVPNECDLDAIAELLGVDAKTLEKLLGSKK